MRGLKAFLESGVIHKDFGKAPKVTDAGSREGNFGKDVGCLRKLFKSIYSFYLEFRTLELFHIIYLQTSQTFIVMYVLLV